MSFQIHKTRYKAIAEDLRKVGTTAIAAALISLFLNSLTLLSAYAMFFGVILWFVGIFMTQEEED